MNIFLNLYNQQILKKSLFIILMSWQTVQGQDIDLVTIDFIPPSPTAYELGKYGQIPVGMFTGVPNINIPLYTYKTNNLSVPVSLNYNSNGIKVDQMATWVGLGWSLLAGGVITRIIKDRPDDAFAGPTMPQREITYANYEYLDMLEFFQYADQDVTDTERDLFMFNFNGYSGTFVMDDNGEIIIMPYQNLMIHGSYIYSEDDVKSGFEIITPDGIKYTFLDAEYSILEGDCIIDDSEYRKSAWYLTSMIHPKGDTIKFTYEGESYSYTTGVSQSRTVLLNVQDECIGGGECPDGGLTECMPISRLNGLRLKEISSNNPSIGKIVFNANTQNPEAEGNFNFLDLMSVRNEDDIEKAKFNFQYLQTPNERTFLTSITFLDATKKYEFEYFSPPSLVSRLSFSQDFWGYYNGAFNTVFYPRITNDTYFLNGGDRSPNGSVAKTGLLKTMTYPTKGYTEFQYEPNDVYEYTTTYDIVRIPKITLDEGTALEETFTVADNLTINLPPYESKIFLQLYEKNGITCPFGLPYWMRVRLLDTETNDYLTFNNGQEFLEVNEFSISDDVVVEEVISLISGHEYEVQLEKNHDCLEGTVDIIYHTAESSITNNETGGLRISKTIDHNEANDNDEVKKYYYGSMNNLNVSSADPGQKGYFIRDVTTEHLCDYLEIPPSGNPFGGCFQCHYKQISSSSIIPLYNTGNNNVYYRYVTVSHGGDNFENGGEEHKFIINRDQSGQFVYGNGAYLPENRGSSNTGWNHGFKESIKTFVKENDGTLTIVKEVTNQYKKDDRFAKETFNYIVTKRYDPMCLRPPLYYECKEEDIDSYRLYERCTTGHNHQRNLGAKGVGATQVCFADGHENRFTIDPINLTNPFFIFPPFNVQCETSHQHEFQSIKRKDIIIGPCISFNNNHLISIDYSRCRNKAVGDTIYDFSSIDHINIIKYKNLSNWHYMNYTATTLYDQNGNNPITTTTNYYYDNPEHLQLTRQATTDSEEKVIETKLRYPSDYASPVRSQALDSLVNRHIINPVIEQVQTVAGQVVSATAIEYEYDAIKNLALPKNIHLLNANQSLADYTESSDGLTFDNRLEKRTTYHHYDSKGNILEYSKVNDVHTAYIWGYNQSYPIAKIENATNGDDIVYTSENIEDITTRVDYSFGGGTNIPMSNVVVSGITQSITISYAFTKENVNDTDSYNLYFSIGNYNSATVSLGSGDSYLTGDLTISNIPPDTYDFAAHKEPDTEVIGEFYYEKRVVTQVETYGRTTEVYHENFEEYEQADLNNYTGRYCYSGSFDVPLQKIINGEYIITYWSSSDGTNWNKMEESITVNWSSTTYAIGGTGIYLDDVRLHPNDALMTTYTYDPLVGMTSQTDPNGNTTYFEYDEFSRLESIKDHEGNIVKHYDYHYKVQQ